MTYDLFISHSSADAEAALALVNEIESRGILKCWVAPRDIPIGASYQREIVRAIKNCGGFVLLLSGNANESDHVLRELELAAQAKKAIYPVKIDDADPAEGIKYYLASTQWVERKAYGNRLVEIIEQLVASTQGTGGGVDRPPAPPTPPAPMPKPKPGISPILIGAIAVALLILAGGGVVVWQQMEAKRIAQEEQFRKEQEKQEAARREEERVRKEKEEQERKEAQERKAAEEEKQRQQAAKDAERRKQAALQPVSLPVQPSVEIEIQKKAPTMGEAVPGKTFFRECDLCPVMAVVPRGSNLIGSPPEEIGRSSNEGPQQPVNFHLPLAVARAEISFEEYLACIAEGGCTPDRPGDYGWGYDKQPAMNLSWNDANRYVAWLSQKTKARYRLLSESEWEYAARGCAKVCDSMPFWFGNQISKDRANYDWRYAYLGSPKAQARRKTVPVDSGEANPFGLLNVHGNVREWVEDCWNESLAGLPRDGTARTSGDCNRRVVRGGSWNDEPKNLRSAARYGEVPTQRQAEIGFRVARELVP